MRFKCTVEDIDLVIEIFRDENYKAPNPLVNFSLQDLEDMKDGIVQTFSVMVESTKGDQSMKHYSSGVLLSSNEEEVQEELEEILDDYGIIEHILKHWSINNSNNLKPEWAKN
jgi:hypothetical protein